MWQKLKSKKYCEDIYPLFGVENLEELKKKVILNREIGGYQGCFESPPTIMDSIKLEEIGSVN